MRTMLKCVLDTEASNKAIHDGSLGTIIEKLMQRTQPEATYFTADGGHRTIYVFFDMKESADMPYVGEMLFDKFKANVTVQPVMSPEELKRGLAKTFQD